MRGAPMAQAGLITGPPSPCRASASSDRTFLMEKSTGRPDLLYEPVGKLGEGAFGVAHLVRDRRSGQERVLKTICKRQSQVPLEQLEREILNLKACDHPHIVRLYEYFEDYENVYLVMERCNGGELLTYLNGHHQTGKNLSEGWTATVLRQCLEAVAYIHGMGIVHKDLKSENILLLHKVPVTEPPHAMLIDLGIAELFSARLGRKGRCSVVAGTPTHMAPEVWQGSFGPVADIWSLAVVLFECLTGRLPFAWKAGPPASAQEWIRLANAGPDWSCLDHCSNEVRALCQRMLVADERMRPTADQCLRHAWFKEAPLEEHALSATQLASLDNYARRSSFEKAILLHVTSQLHLSQVHRITASFRQMDRDGSGTITVPELVSALTQVGIARENAEAAASGLFVDSSGRIDYKEFTSGCVSILWGELRSALWQAFVHYDVNGNGRLQRDKIRCVLDKLDLTKLGFVGVDLEESLNRLAPNGDNVVTFDEFCKLFLAPDLVKPTPLAGAHAGVKDSLAPASVSPAVQAASQQMPDEDFVHLLDQIEADNSSRAPSRAQERKTPPPAEPHATLNKAASASQFGSVVRRNSRRDSRDGEEDADEKLDRMLDEIINI